MRVTNRMIGETLKYAIQVNMEKLSRTQQGLATGKRVHHPSDDPSAISRLMNLKGSLEGNEQYVRNIDDGLSYLEAADTAFGTISELFQKAHEYAVQGANGTLTEDDMRHIAEQIDKLIDNLVDLANTAIGGKYIFAGKDNAEPPFERVGDKIIYKGDFEDIEREILFGTSYRVAGAGVSNSAVSGSSGAPFGWVTEINGEYIAWDGSWDESSAPHESVFSAFFILRNALNSGDQKKVSQAIATLQDKYDYILQERVKVGARTRHFEAVKQQMLDHELLIKQSIVNIDGVDIEKTSIDLAQQQLNYQGALSAGANILQISLLHFIS